MQVTDEMIDAFYTAHDASLEMQPREGHQAVYDGLAAALSKAEPVGVGVKELIAMMRGRVGDTFNEVAEFSAEEVETIISSLSLPCKENGETVPPAQQMSLGLILIAAERERQIAKGYDAAHDDTHKAGEIITASWGAVARIYAANDRGRSGDVNGYKRYLAQAGAQIAAEIERVDRAALASSEGRE